MTIRRMSLLGAVLLACSDTASPRVLIDATTDFESGDMDMWAPDTAFVQVGEQVEPYSFELRAEVPGNEGTCLFMGSDNRTSRTHLWVAKAFELRDGGRVRITARWSMGPVPSNALGVMPIVAIQDHEPVLHPDSPTIGGEFTIYPIWGPAVTPTPARFESFEESRALTLPNGGEIWVAVGYARISGSSAGVCFDDLAVRVEADD